MSAAAAPTEAEEHQFLDEARQFQKDHDEYVRDLEYWLRRYPQIVNTQARGRRWSALQQAAYGGHLTALRSLIELGASRQLRTPQGWTVLQLVAAVIYVVANTPALLGEDHEDLRRQAARARNDRTWQTQWMAIQEHHPQLIERAQGDIEQIGEIRIEWIKRLLDDQEDLRRELERDHDTFFVVLRPGDVIISKEARTLLLSTWVQTQHPADLRDITLAINEQFGRDRQDFMDMMIAVVKWRCVGNALARCVLGAFEVEEGHVLHLMTKDFRLDDSQLGRFAWLARPLAMMLLISGDKRLVVKHLLVSWRRHPFRCRNAMSVAMFFWTILYVVAVTKMATFLFGSTMLYFIYRTLYGLVHLEPMGILHFGLLIIGYWFSQVLAPLRKALLPRVPMLWIKLFRRLEQHGHGPGAALAQPLAAADQPGA